MRRVCFHYPPVHASWLNMAEIAIGRLSRQCLGRHIPAEPLLQTELTAWLQFCNTYNAMIHWSFTLEDARQQP